MEIFYLERNQKVIEGQEYPRFHWDLSTMISALDFSRKTVGALFTEQLYSQHEDCFLSHLSQLSATFGHYFWLWIWLVSDRIWHLNSVGQLQLMGVPCQGLTQVICIHNVDDPDCHLFLSDRAVRKQPLHPGAAVKRHGFRLQQASGVPGHIRQLVPTLFTTRLIQETFGNCTTAQSETY